MRWSEVFLAASVLTLTSALRDDDDTAVWISDIVKTTAKRENKLEQTVSADSDSDSDIDLSLSHQRNTEQSKATNNDGDILDLSPSLNNKRIRCALDDGRTGFCVLYYQCDTATRNIIIDGTGIIDTRKVQCSHYLETCCIEKEIHDEAQNLSPSPYQVLASHKTDSVHRFPELVTTESNDEDYVDLTPDRYRNENATPLAEVTSTPAAMTTTIPQRFATNTPATPKQNKTLVPECGWSNPGAYIFLSRSLAQAQLSKYANYAEFPWMVAVMKRSDDDTWSTADYIGGGSIIHPSVVLTVAHKFLATTKRKEILASQVKCRAGEWDTQTTNEQYKFQERNVAKYTIHPEYYSVSLYYDAALLFLEQPFRIDPTFSPHMGVACLAPAQLPAGQSCYSMGWGTELTGSKTNANILKKEALDLVDSEQCKTMLQKTRLGPYFKLHKSLTCAGGRKGIDTCRGDGGSSLVCPIGGDSDTTRYAVYGMVSYGIDCGKENVPGVYVKIPEVLGWVNEQMTAEGYGTASYTYSD